MCSLSSGPKAPEYIPPPAPLKKPDEVASQSRNRERRRAAAAKGASSTIRTGAGGLLSPAAISAPTLFGT